ncbi:MAG: hydrolase [Pirellulaceae bacterium]
MAHSKLPPFNMDLSETDCCPRFDPTGWDGEEFEFRDRLFVRATTRNFLHIPLNMKSVITNTFAKIEEAGAAPEDEYLMLSSDLSPWRGELYFAVTKELPDVEMVKLSGTFLAKVFEGGFQNMGRWSKELTGFVESKGKQIKKCFFFYTTCPKCAKVYGKNYVVGFPQIAG